MSDMYFTDNTLKDLDERKTVSVSKASSARSCAVCQGSIDDGVAIPMNIGQGLEVLLHRECMGDIMDALTPKATTIPVSTDSKQAVSKSVLSGQTGTRKSTVSTSPTDKDDLKERIRYEFSLLLLKHGFLTQ